MLKMFYFVKLSLLLLDNILNIFLNFGLMTWIKVKKHLLKLLETDKFMLTMKLINTGEATKTTGLTFFIEAYHKNFLVMASTLGAESINLSVFWLHDFEKEQ